MGNLNKNKTEPRRINTNQHNIESIRFLSCEVQTVTKFIQDSPYHNIGSLNITGCRVGVVGIKILTQQSWPVLNNLTLTQNRLGNQGILHLAKMQSRKLKSLSLRNGLTDEGVRGLIKGHWTQLRDVTFNQQYGREKRVNRVTSFGIRQIHQMPHRNKSQLKPSASYTYLPEIINQIDII